MRANSQLKRLLYVTGTLFVFRFPVDPLNPRNPTVEGLIIPTDILGRFKVTRGRIAVPRSKLQRTKLVGSKNNLNTKMCTHIVCVDTKNDFWRKFGLKTKIVKNPSPNCTSGHHTPLAMTDVMPNRQRFSAMKIKSSIFSPLIFHTRKLPVKSLLCRLKLWTHPTRA